MTKIIIIIILKKDKKYKYVCQNKCANSLQQCYVNIKALIYEYKIIFY